MKSINEELFLKVNKKLGKKQPVLPVMENIDDKLFASITDKLNKLKEEQQEIVIAPITPPEEVLPIPNSIPPIVSQTSPEVVNILTKQTELITNILTVLVQQNEAIKELMNKETKQSDKVIILKYDERGNPIGAEIKVKPTQTEKENIEEDIHQYDYIGTPNI